MDGHVGAALGVDLAADLSGNDVGSDLRHKGHVNYAENEKRRTE